MNAVDMRPQEVRVVDTDCGGEIVVMAPEKVEGRLDYRGSSWRFNSSRWHSA